MDVSLFHYKYPESLVAQHPLTKREDSRMMVLDRQASAWEHASFKDFIKWCRPGDVLVLNDTKVFPARLYGTSETGRTFEVLLLSQTASHQWTCLASPMKHVKTGVRLDFSGQLQGVLTGEGYEARIRFEPTESFSEILADIGLVPLPPYIERPHTPGGSVEDRDRYQTVYAQHEGSAAAPTAGLHVSASLLEQLRHKGVHVVPVTLHVGRDTFQPVRVEKLADHVMHGETYQIPPETLETIQQAKAEGRRVIAVGTTTARALESGGEGGNTHLFITPGYEFKVVDALLTNFHQPESTLLMMVSALAGREFLLSAYQEAIAQEYRLFSYGDCMLIV
jgi:S-adenosylmethionine:tRNA ribosyltransferase-isomerase